MPLGYAATHNDGMGCGRPVFWLGCAGLSCAALCCKRRKNWENRKRRSGCECEGGVQKVMLVPLQEIRSNTVGPVVASLLRHEEKGRERGKKRKVLHRKIWQRFAGWLGGEGRRGMTWGFKGFGRAAAPIFKSGRTAARVHGHARAGTSSCRSLESGGRVDWCKDAEGRTGQGPDAHDWSEVRAAGRWDLNLGARGVGGDGPGTVPGYLAM